MQLRAPDSQVFPYTTLFRSAELEVEDGAGGVGGVVLGADGDGGGEGLAADQAVGDELVALEGEAGDGDGEDAVGDGGAGVLAAFVEGQVERGGGVEGWRIDVADGVGHELAVLELFDGGSERRRLWTFELAGSPK